MTTTTRRRRRRTAGRGRRTGRRTCRRRTWEGHPQRLEGRGHGVGGVHPAARGRPGAAVLDDLPALGVRDLVVEVLAVGLEGDDDVEGLPHGGPRPGADGPAVHHDRGLVEAAHGDDDAGLVLVAAGQRDEVVVPPLKRTERRRRKPTSLRRTEEADKTMTSWLVSRRTVI